MAKIGIKAEDAAKALEIILPEWLGGGDTTWLVNAYFTEGLTTTEIADILNVDQGTVVRRINTVRRKLRMIGHLPAAWESRRSCNSAT